MSRNRFYIGKTEQEDLEHLEEWIASRVPLPPPEGTKCENTEHITYANPLSENEGPDAKATTYLYRIEDGHVCYTYVCAPCGEQADDGYLSEHEYPTSQDGYAVVPKHCT